MNVCGVSPVSVTVSVHVYVYAHVCDVCDCMWMFVYVSDYVTAYADYACMYVDN